MLGWLTDMDDVALLVQHDVAIVPVLDLQQEQQEAVGSHASDEVVTCLCEVSLVLMMALRAASARACGCSPDSMLGTSMQGQ